MKVHEYQAKELFRAANVPVPEGKVAFTAEEAIQNVDALGSFPVVVKAQIHAGGRGKGGGVKVAKTKEDAKKYIDEILGMTLVTKQTGPEGKLVQKLLIEEGLDIRKELYLSILPDRATAKNIIMASEEGGMDIEEVAEKTPEKIIKVYIDPNVGIRAYHLNALASGLNVPKEYKKALSGLVKNLYNMFSKYDCSMVEINPLVYVGEDKVVALDAKVDVDSNSLYRHKDVLEYRDLDEEDPLEREASKYGLNYINLGGGGNVGSMVNGAGLAMATMDAIKFAGARPANFLDVGGGANAEMIANGFQIILSDKNVKAILINIFGGILRCDTLANGVVEAAQKIGLSVPLVIRMEGTNVEKGKEILANSGIDIINAETLKDATSKVAKLV